VAPTEPDSDLPMVSVIIISVSIGKYSTNRDTLNDSKKCKAWHEQ
jgi:hypothetical protein